MTTRRSICFLRPRPTWLVESGLSASGSRPEFCGPPPCASTLLVHHRRMRFSLFLIAAAQAASLHGAVAATIPPGRYTCVLSGQGSCSDEGTCLGNRVSPIDKSIRLEVDFKRRTASLNKIIGRLEIEAGKSPVIRWYLSTMGDVSVAVNEQSSRTWITLAPERGSGATANFNCRDWPT